MLCFLSCTKHFLWKGFSHEMFLLFFFRKGLSVDEWRDLFFFQKILGKCMCSKIALSLTGLKAHIDPKDIGLLFCWFEIVPAFSLGDFRIFRLWKIQCSTQCLLGKHGPLTELNNHPFSFLFDQLAVFGGMKKNYLTMNLCFVPLVDQWCLVLTWVARVWI